MRASCHQTSRSLASSMCIAVANRSRARAPLTALGDFLWTAAGLFLLFRFGFRQPTAAQLLFRNTRQIRLDVEYRCAVKHVDTADEQLVSVAPQELDQG